jgi:hypothetical protein
MRWWVVALCSSVVACAAWMCRSRSPMPDAAPAHLTPDASSRLVTETHALVAPESPKLGGDSRVEHAVDSDNAASSTNSAKPDSEAVDYIAHVVVLASDEFGRPLPQFRLVFDDRTGLKMATGVNVGNEPEIRSFNGRDGVMSANFQIKAGRVWSGSARVCALGRYPASVQLELVAGAEWKGQFALQPVPPNIFGVVRDATGQAASGIILQASGDPTELYGMRDGTQSEVLVTDENGAFTFRIVRKEAARLVVVDGERATRRVLQPRDLGPNMDVRLPATARLSGRLVDSGGRAVTPVRVQLRSLEYGAVAWLAPALVVDDGAYEFDTAPTGALELGVWRLVGPGHWSPVISVPLTLASGETRTLDVEVPEVP